MIVLLLVAVASGAGRELLAAGTAAEPWPAGGKGPSGQPRRAVAPPGGESLVAGQRAAQPAAQECAAFAAAAGPTARSPAAGARSFIPTARFFVAPKGDDQRGDGSPARPWRTLRHAVRSVPDVGAEIVLAPGEYPEFTSIGRHFTRPMRIRSEVPYGARLASTPDRHRVLHIEGASNIIIAGFEICGRPGGSDDYLVQVTTEETYRILFENNIFHDSYKNDIMKINSRAHQIIVRGNMFYNQPRGGDEHIDVNTVYDILIEDNVFFNDFAASGRPVENITHPFVLIKNSGSEQVSRNFTVRRNVFFHWQGKSDQPFLLLGEDGKPFHEAQRVLIENNLFLGTTGNKLTAAFAVKGAKDVIFRANTIHGDLPLGSLSWGFAMRLGVEGQNPPNENIAFYNNIFSDPTGTMTRFSSGAQQNVRGAVLRNNLYFNGGQPIPVEPGRALNISDDPQAILADPGLPAKLDDVIPPVWQPQRGQFADGSQSIAEARQRLIERYGTPRLPAVIDRADPRQMPQDDILHRPRGQKPDLGAVEVRP